MSPPLKKHIYSGAGPKRVAADLAPLVDFKREGMSQTDLSSLIHDRLIPHLMRYDRPEFQSMFNAFPEQGAEWGARLALTYNQGVTNWQVSPGGAVLEELCCQALCRLFGFGRRADATFMYSGTYANQQALYMALHRWAEQKGFSLSELGLNGFENGSGLRVLATGHAHFSLRHAVRMLGLGDRSLIPVEMDANYRMDPADLRKKLESAGPEREIFCVLATAGTTSTGAVDPLDQIVPICRKHKVWLHVDGAYGLAYSLVPQWRDKFRNFEKADSVSWDPHKQMGVPIPCSLLFARNRKDFGRMSVHSGYFNREADPEPNPGLKSPPSTRPFSALPLVTSLRLQGLEGLIRRLQAPLNAVGRLHEYCRNLPDIRVCHTPDTGICCLRAVPSGLPENELDRLQETIHRTILKEGKRSVSVTKLRGKTVLRLLAVSPEVTFEALKDSIEEIRRLAGKTYR